MAEQITKACGWVVEVSRPAPDVALQFNVAEPIKVVEDHVASPTYSPALASRTADLVEKGLRGVFHIGGGTPISWFDYAKLIFRLAGLSPQLKPTDERQYRTAARRPKYSALSNAKMEAAGLHAMPTMEAAVASYLEQRQRLMPVTA